MSKVQTLLKPLDLPIYPVAEQYNVDKLDVSTLDIYLSSTEKQQSIWKYRGHLKDNFIDFTLCQNLYIREQYRYYVYSIIVIDKLLLSTVASYTESFTYLFDYINEHALNLKSVCDIIPQHYNQYLFKNKISLYAKAGMKLTSGMEKREITVKSKFLTILNKFIQVIQNYEEKDMDEYEKDIWVLQNLPHKINNNISNRILTLNFKGINQLSIRNTTKQYVILRIPSYNINTINLDLVYITQFCKYLTLEYPYVNNLSDLTRNIMESYLISLRTSNKKENLIARSISTLKVFFETSQLMKIEDKPHHALILKSDYRQIQNTEVHILTDTEMKSIYTYLSDLPSQIALMFFCHAQTGFRISELCELKIEMLKKNPDESFEIEYFQSKTNATNTICVENLIGKIITKAYEDSCSSFGPDTTYVFAQSNKTPIRPFTYSSALNKLIYDRKIMADSGELLHITTHMLRATYASKLSNLELDTNIVNKLLGHLSKNSIKSYVKASSEVMSKYLKPVLKYQDFMINSIFHPSNPDDILDLTDGTYLPLDNGFCVQEKEFGLCHHANACLGCSMFVPSLEHLPLYKAQLNNFYQNYTVCQLNGFQKESDYYLSQIQKLESIITTLKGGTENE